MHSAYLPHLLLKLPLQVEAICSSGDQVHQVAGGAGSQPDVAVVCGDQGRPPPHVWGHDQAGGRGVQCTVTQVLEHPVNRDSHQLIGKCHDCITIYKLHRYL